MSPRGADSSYLEMFFSVVVLSLLILVSLSWAFMMPPSLQSSIAL
jgi:hypothetical protein